MVFIELQFQTVKTDHKTETSTFCIVFRLYYTHVCRSLWSSYNSRFFFFSETLHFSLFNTTHINLIVQTQIITLVLIIIHKFLLDLNVRNNSKRKVLICILINDRVRQTYTTKENRVHKCTFVRGYMCFPFFGVHYKECLPSIIVWGISNM